MSWNSDMELVELADCYFRYFELSVRLTADIDRMPKITNKKLLDELKDWDKLGQVLKALLMAKVNDLYRKLQLDVKVTFEPPEDENVKP